MSYGLMDMEMSHTCMWHVYVNMETYDYTAKRIDVTPEF